VIQFFTRFGSNESLPVEMIMVHSPITVSPDTATVIAMDLMRSSGIGCLPVVENARLVGIVTTQDLLMLSARLLRAELQN